MWFADTFKLNKLKIRPEVRGRPRNVSPESIPPRDVAASVGFVYFYGVASVRPIWCRRIMYLLLTDSAGRLFSVLARPRPRTIKQNNNIINTDSELNPFGDTTRVAAPTAVPSEIWQRDRGVSRVSLFFSFLNFSDEFLGIPIPALGILDEYYIDRNRSLLSYLTRTHSFKNCYLCASWSRHEYNYVHCPELGMNKLNS